MKVKKLKACIISLFHVAESKKNPTNQLNNQLADRTFR